ncbi:HlyD family secretion protein [Dyadobacter frigoris]|uniref:HlyD family secretion protein n=1 Tax=Dyadobacter frigoris TaxID=2576211 RepID=A0A4U6CR08_9BACT|nr:HlyD family secretion protein [Dyadobacter frigoris]TKT86949.1 HlyD family secretion protein [Dyadobacter frigoris]GLU56544.1 multidrug resistance protein [Dyadobacter frigoris]
MGTEQNQFNNSDKLITRITAWIAGFILLGLSVWGGLTLWDLWKYEETEDAQIEEYINPVTSRVGGFIRDIRYEENQPVKKGDTLLIIDNREYQLGQEEAEAALLNAKAQISVLKSTVETSSKNATVNEGQIAAAKAKLWHQEQEFARYEKLLQVEAVTQQQFENAKTALEVAKADYQSFLDTYQASLSKVNDIKVQQEVALAEIQRREAILDRNKLDVSYTVVTAPYDGKMGRKTIQNGQMIQAGQTLAYIVDQQEGKWVIANFKETQIRHMHTGQMVDIETDALPGEHFNGKIVSLSPATGSRFSLLPPDNSTGNFVKITQRIPVRILLTDAKSKTESLRAGMNAMVLVKKGV